MASKSVSDAVAAYLAANFDSCAVRTMNETLEPNPDGSTFLQVQYPLALERQQSIGSPGSNVYREEGAIRLVLVAQTGSSVSAVLLIADELRNLFRDKRFEGVRTFEAAPAVLDDASDQAGSFVISFAVAYEFDIFA